MLLLLLGSSLLLGSHCLFCYRTCTQLARLGREDRCPHLHCLEWLVSAPPVRALQERLDLPLLLLLGSHCCLWDRALLVHFVQEESLELPLLLLPGSWLLLGIRFRR